MDFHLDNFTPAKLASVNVRAEHHGDELVPAVDLKFELTMPNAHLGMLDEDLCESLYLPNSETGERQVALTGIPPVSRLPNLRYAPLASPMRWEEEQDGLTLDIDWGIGDALHMHSARISRLAFEPLDGGSVNFAITVQSTSGAPPDEHTMGRLGLLAQRDVRIRLANGHA